MARSVAVVRMVVVSRGCCTIFCGFDLGHCSRYNGRTILSMRGLTVRMTIGNAVTLMVAVRHVI
jgi:hypothetical protein